MGWLVDVCIVIISILCIMVGSRACFIVGFLYSGY